MSENEDKATVEIRDGGKLVFTHMPKKKTK